MFYREINAPLDMPAEKRLASSSSPTFRQRDNVDNLIITSEKESSRLMNGKEKRDSFRFLVRWFFVWLLQREIFHLFITSPIFVLAAAVNWKL